ncbi:MAG: hypothetical protein HFH91_19450 [Lachnospiraceae bacterium]|nr:hypothetical protein [Lachnospiraceae bacterium]
MADIKYYLKEKEKRERKQRGYKKKIVRHKLTAWYRVLLILFLLAAVIVFMAVRYKNHIYMDYDTLSSIKRETVTGARDVRLGDAVLTYSKDGAHCTDIKGEVSWNQTFEIQNAKLAVCGNTVAIGNYNGRNIYIADSEKLLGEINTTMPIRDIAVALDGTVTAVLADTDVTWVNTYNSQGKQQREGRTHMDDSGYPMALSLSPNGQMLCVSYVYVDAGVLRTRVVFYDFSQVGSNVSDSLATVWDYTDMLIPEVRFVSNDKAFAVGDNMLVIYSGNHKPSPEAGHQYDGEVQSVFYSDRYIGLVFHSDDNENRYRMDVYDTANATSKPKKFYFNFNYTDIFFEKNSFVIYNETECQIMTMDGVEKFHGNFTKMVRLMLPAGGGYKYLLVTDTSLDTIQLK